MNFNCAGDYNLQEEWLKKHQNADLIEYDSKHNIPSKAIYINPLYRSYVLELTKFFTKLKRLMTKNAKII